MNTILDEQNTVPSYVRKWKKILLNELARQLQPSGDLFTEPRIFSDETDQASFEEAAYLLRRELDRRAR